MIAQPFGGVDNALLELFQDGVDEILAGGLPGITDQVAGLGAQVPRDHVGAVAQLLNGALDARVHLE